MTRRTRTYGTPEIQEQILEQLRIAAKSIGGDAGKVIEGDELIAYFGQLGADRMLLAAIGSWGDTLEPDEILGMLKRWNREEAEA